jgi:hypothetical protein
MPKIQWERLPREKRSHVRERAKERQISEQNLFELAEWKMQDPDVPDATGARISEHSSCVALASFLAPFC